MNQAIIAAGSNISPEINLKKAQEEISKSYQLLRCSEILQTSPLINTQQADFMNVVFFINTSSDYDFVRQNLKKLEDQLGRIRSPEKRFGPLTIDLDIVLWNSQILRKEVYQHPFLRKLIEQVYPGFQSEYL